MEPERPPRFFIAHSSGDKEFALELHDALSGDAWVDLYEIAIGQIILEEIAEGIEGATDFVVLWSANSSVSRWMRFEFHMAFIRHVEDTAISIRILCLDETPVPLYLRPFLQAREIESPGQAAALLLGPAPRQPTVRAFVNRNAEIDTVERVLYSSRVVQAWFTGLAGVGKRALVKEAIRRLIPDQTRPRVVDVRPGTGFVELDLVVTSLLGANPPPESLTEQEAQQRSVDAIQAYAEAGGLWLFTEVQHWLDEDARPGPVLTAVLAALDHALASRSDALVIFTTTRRPVLEGVAARTSSVERVRGLAAEFGVALLRARGATSDQQALERATSELDGHPMTLEIVAGQLGRGDVDWEDLRITAATTVLNDIALGSTTTSLLERVAAVDGPLAAEDYAQHLGIDDEALQRAIVEAVSYSLLRESDGGFLQLHALVRDHFMRSFRRDPEFQEKVSDLADRAKSLLETTPVGTIVYVDALVMTFKLLGWSMRLEEALKIRRNLYGTLMETAVELYHQRRYREARRYFELVIESTDSNARARLFLARTLAYLGEIEDARHVVEGVIAERPTDHHAWRVRGRVEFIARDFTAAIAFYERANELKPGVPAVLRDLGQARMRVGDWHGARAALERAVQGRRDPDPWILFQYSLVLEHFGEYEEALVTIEQAIRRDPSDVGFHHRRGRIAEELGDLATAKREYETCLRLDSSFMEALLSLASLAVDQGDFDAANEYLSRRQQLGRAPARVVSNLRAKIALAQGDIAAARTAVQDALSEERDVPNLDLAARIELEAVARGEAACSEISNSVRQYAADMRVAGAMDQSDALLAKLAEACG